MWFYPPKKDGDLVSILSLFVIKWEQHGNIFTCICHGELCFIFFVFTLYTWQFFCRHDKYVAMPIQFLLPWHFKSCFFVAMVIKQYILPWVAPWHLGVGTVHMYLPWQILIHFCHGKIYSLTMATSHVFCHGYCICFFPHIRKMIFWPWQISNVSHITN